MRILALTAALLTGLAGSGALAQTPLAPPGVPYGANPETGARPGNIVGTGMSMPMSDRASHIGPDAGPGLVAPNLPTPEIGEDASPVDLLRAAEGAVAAGRTGEAQQALEMAQTRLLDRSVPLGQTDRPSSHPAVQQISQALRALGAGDRAACLTFIQAAIPQAAQTN